jgi:hypothetical protein
VDWRYSAVLSSAPLLQASSPTSTLLYPLSSNTNPLAGLSHAFCCLSLSVLKRGGRGRGSRYKFPWPECVAYVFVSLAQVTLQMRVCPFRFSVKDFFSPFVFAAAARQIFFHWGRNPLPATVVIIPRIPVSLPNSYLLACLTAFLLCCTRRLPGSSKKNHHQRTQRKNGHI